jgi:hypothetical protein
MSKQPVVKVRRAPRAGCALPKGGLRARTETSDAPGWQGVEEAQYREYCGDEHMRTEGPVRWTRPRSGLVQQRSPGGMQRSSNAGRLSPRAARRLVVVLSAVVAGAARGAIAGESQVADSVVVGKETKRTTGTVTGLEAGDVACYISLEDDKGSAFQELADFAVCEQTSLIGERVRLTYELGKVMADECGGNPDCKKSRTVALVMSARVMPAKSGQTRVTPSRELAAPQTSFCTPLETVVFACRTSSKLVSVCASNDASPTTGYLQYRFGKPDSREPMEMTLPEGEIAPPKAASGENVPFSGGGGSWLRFRRGDTSYVVYSGIGKWGPKGETMEKQGVVVERGASTVTNLSCTGALTSELGPDWFDRTGVTAKGQDFLFPDPPPAKKR